MAGSSATPHPDRCATGEWLVGHGVAAGFRNNLLEKSGARVHLEQNGTVTVETDMTDIGTGSYTILAQTAAEMLGVPLEQVAVHLGDSSFPVSAGSGGQWGREYLHLRRLRRLYEASRNDCLGSRV